MSRDPPESKSVPDGRPDRIGPYTILDVLGEGGMGTVYKAEQKEPVRRLVALKLIKLGMDTKDVLARFELERRALAAMSHTSIARVLEAGTTERGQPYFVMELVQGMALTLYCDKHRLSVKERIELFAQVCAGVQHAHQKGVVHRDLKPGNIIVVREEERAVVKILDFGLAKAMNRDLLVQTIYTEREQILGTPEYMAPEQATFDEEAVDTRADIYSLGVILYELLAGELPFPSADLRREGWLEIQRKLAEDEPQKPSTKLSTVGELASEFAHKRRTSVHALSRELRGDLDWIVLKAMAKEPERRYASAAGMALDLRRHLEHEPVLAGPPSARYRLRKLVRRYRGQVAAGVLVLLALVAGVVGTTMGLMRAEDNEQRAIRERNRADAKVREFDQLAGVVHLETALVGERELYPAWPEKIAAMRRWLDEDAGKLLSIQPELERTVRDLEARALPQTAEEAAADRQTHPRLPELDGLAAKLAALRRAQAVREGSAQVEEPGLPADLATMSAAALNEIAWSLVNSEDQKRTWGREAVALAIARRAVATASDLEKPNLADTLAWALFANGLDDDALAMSERARELAPEPQKLAYAATLDKLRRRIEAWRGSKGRSLLAAVEREFAGLEAEVSRRRTWQFERESQRFLHDTLAELIAKIDAFLAKEQAGVAKRLFWAERIEAATRLHPGAGATWEQARAAIARGDGAVASELYRAHPVELQPQRGLVPIGMNPQTKLWEFYHLRSAWDPVSGVDPTAIEIPTHRPDGSIEVTGDTGIVFVLLPGGTFTMGAQSEDPSLPHYDPWAQRDETPHQVTLAPFFLARHEMTKGQWKRLSHGEEPSYYEIGTIYDGNPVSVGYAHPVEQVDLPSCDTLLTRHGMVLPTEAQWEYGCRAGTTTRFSCGEGPRDLEGFANVLDQSASRYMPAWGRGEAFDDGFTSLAPVGYFAANAFGLFDVHGNVWEWCREGYGSYSLPTAPGDGARQVERYLYSVYRGAGADGSASQARSANRNIDTATIRRASLGVRPARSRS